MKAKTKLLMVLFVGAGVALAGCAQPEEAGENDTADNGTADNGTADNGTLPEEGDVAGESPGQKDTEEEPIVTDEEKEAAENETDNETTTNDSAMNETEG